MQRRRLSLLLLAAGLGLAAPAATAHTRPAVDRILVVKHERKMYLFSRGEVVRVMRIALGRRPRGPKRRAGDGRTPEGLYFIDGFLPESDFYKALHLSYPNARDRARARAEGVDPGGQILIHGLDPAIDEAFREIHWMFNWTNGCIAVTDREMDWLWQSVSWGTPVEIRP